MDPGETHASRAETLTWGALMGAASPGDTSSVRAEWSLFRDQPPPTSEWPQDPERDQGASSRMLPLP